eukprot:scaffold83159_cov42-Phaeocystis_antarctica.AAC.1
MQLRVGRHAACACSVVVLHDTTHARLQPGRPGTSTHTYIHIPHLSDPTGRAAAAAPAAWTARPSP